MIDLYSDTATLPTDGMWAAMRIAQLGDEQRGTDPTVVAVEARVASLLGKEAALLVPSATMANQVAFTVHCQHGSEVLCHETAHVYHFEGGGLATNARAQAVPLSGERGVFSGEILRAALRPEDPHFPKSQVVVVENTSNLAGGTVWAPEAYAEVVAVCREHQLKLHLDGARLFNAAVAHGIPVTAWSRDADSVQVCFSKGLGCPFGAILAGSREFIHRARRVRQSFGGALRQAGIVAAAIMYALDNHVDRLLDDHRRLAHLASALSDYPGLEVLAPETNLLYFRSRRIANNDAIQALERAGVLVSAVGPWLRACTHLGVTDADTVRAVAAFEAVFARPT
jgi:threonine aldolase